MPPSCSQHLVPTQECNSLIQPVLSSQITQKAQEASNLSPLKAMPTSPDNKKTLQQPPNSKRWRKSDPTPWAPTGCAELQSLHSTVFNEVTKFHDTDRAPVSPMQYLIEYFGICMTVVCYSNESLQETVGSEGRPAVQHLRQA